ncbi:hypothetical protein COV82_02740 [Candidatus Peregrinibacteria bacterium CG11_big_fil_rev_8_21_14_0_20_46_8]|nr:MAG: hypothetical protein COV82_02740 [Candidatus Peregrinibacteria bacterium CG11_big_fil_rev_8_21_14_0_20_46_8]
MEYKTDPWVIVLTIIITALIVAGAFYIWQQDDRNLTPDPIENNEENTIDDVIPDDIDIQNE